MERFVFHGKRALVTGAGKAPSVGVHCAGIGRHVAQALYRCGAQVVAISRTDSDLSSLKAEFPKMATAAVDLGQWETTRKLVDSLGHFDLLVNNAGILRFNNFLDFPKQEMDETWDVNFKAVFNISQVVASKMVAAGKGGSIVNISSVASRAPILAGMSVYGPSKAALDHLTCAMALELGQHKIRVNTVNPTVVWTKMGQWAMNTELGRQMLGLTPIGRFAECDDITPSVLFLLSDQAAMITGSGILVDGGYMCH